MGLTVGRKASASRNSYQRLGEYLGCGLRIIGNRDIAKTNCGVLFRGGATIERSLRN